MLPSIYVFISLQFSYLHKAIYRNGYAKLDQASCCLAVCAGFDIYGRVQHAAETINLHSCAYRLVLLGELASKSVQSTLIAMCVEPVQRKEEIPFAMIKCGV